MTDTTTAVILCTPCLRSDSSVDAVKYCVECNENFCRPCLRRHIKSLLLGQQSHQFLDRDEMPGWLQGVPGISHCTRHPGNKLDTWCCDHDVICCGACAVIEHSTCSNVDDFQQNEDVSGNQSEISNLQANFLSASEELHNLKIRKRQNQSALRKSTADSLASVRAFRQLLNAEFDRLEKQAVEEVDTECTAADNSLEQDIGDIEKSIALIDMSLTKLREAEAEQISEQRRKQESAGEKDSEKDDRNDVEGDQTESSLPKDGVERSIFLDIVNGRRLLKQIMAKYEAIHSKSAQLVQFESNKLLEKYVKSMTNLGFCRKPTERHSTKAAKVNNYSICAEDESICDIQHVIQSDSSNFLLTDAENKSIKILDSTFHILSIQDLGKDTSGPSEDDAKTSNENRTYEPFAICHIDEGRVAVSMVRDKVVEVFEMGEKLAKDYKIDVGEYCRGLAYSEERDELYVACGGGTFNGEGLGHIRVYRKGELVRTFKQASDGKTMSPRPMHLALSMDGSKLFVADTDKGVIMVSAYGELLGIFTAPELEGASGICTDVNNHVIVCGSGSNNILRIHEDWKKYELLLDDPEILNNPQSVCYDSVRSKCVCSLNNKNTVVVFNV